MRNIDGQWSSSSSSLTQQLLDVVGDVTPIARSDPDGTVNVDERVDSVDPPSEPVIGTPNLPVVGTHTDVASV